jgi:hypothetical protein
MGSCESILVEDGSSYEDVSVEILLIGSVNAGIGSSGVEDKVGEGRNS